MVSENAISEDDDSDNADTFTDKDMCLSYG
jgi:hypothetical protein